jgi:hypothetical protein
MAAVDPVTVLGDQLMSGSLQCVPCGSGMLFFYQYVIRVKSRDRKNGHAALGQRIDERGQNAGLREWKRAFELETCPRAFTSGVAGSLVGGAND